MTDQQAITMARRLAPEEGVFAGFSSGANIAAAVELLKGPCRSMTVAVLLCDSGMKYLGADLGVTRGPKDGTAATLHNSRAWSTR